jgi:hypothetical protein
MHLNNQIRNLTAYALDYKDNFLAMDPISKIIIAIEEKSY